MVLYPLGNSSLHEHERGLYGHFRQFECLSFMDSGYRYYGISVYIVAPWHIGHYACLQANRLLANTFYPQTSCSTLTNVL
jgi:hypothetical protein